MKCRWFKFKNLKISSVGDYILQGVSNLETGTATKREVTYIDYDGCDIKDIYYSKRMFEISGFIKADDEQTMVSLKRRLISACSLKESFRIKYFNRERIYSAECYFDRLPTFGIRTKWLLPFKLYVTIPGFFWQSAVAHKVNLFRYSDEVIDTFTLPCVFTSMVSSAEVVNSGDEKSYPIFTVSCQDDNSGSTIIISNSTAGKTIKLNYKTRKNEIVKIDTFNQIVTSNINGNITRYVTLDSKFFALEKGVNHLNCNCVGNIVTFEFYENFLGV